MTPTYRLPTMNDTSIPTWTTIWNWSTQWNTTSPPYKWRTQINGEQNNVPILVNWTFDFLNTWNETMKLNIAKLQINNIWYIPSLETCNNSRNLLHLRCSDCRSGWRGYRGAGFQDTGIQPWTVVGGRNSAREMWQKQFKKYDLMTKCRLQLKGVVFLPFFNIRLPNLRTFICFLIDANSI